MGTQLLSSTSFRFFKVGWLLMVIMLIPGHAFSQTTVSGEVISQENGEVMPAVNIQVKGTTTGTTSDANGQYELTVESLQDTLVVSFVGYQTQEVPINGRTQIDIALQSEAVTGEELVVVGYSEQSRENITGSVSIVDVEEMQTYPSSSAEQALQGQASGVNIRTTGSPGESSDIRIRGISNFGDSEPLVLVDGVEADMNDVHPNEIESIQVLKDAGSAAIYGVRGANGVILITTKKGQTGAPTVSYESYFGMQYPLPGDPYDILSPRDQMQVELEANPNHQLYGDGTLPDYFYYTPEEGAGAAMEGNPIVDPSNYYFDPENPLNSYIIQEANHEGTNWYQEIFNPAPRFNQNLSISGGTDNSNYFLSLGHVNRKGTLLHTHLKRYSVRLNTSFDLSENIRIGENINVYYRDNPLQSSNTGQFGTALAYVYQVPKILPVFDIGGNYAGTRAAIGVGSRSNPYAVQDRNASDRDKSWNIVGNAFIEIDLLENLSARSSLGSTYETTHEHSFSYTAYEDPEGFNNPNGFSESSGYSSRLTWSNTFEYQNLIGNHSFKILGGTELISNRGRSVWGSRDRYFSSNFDYTTLSTGTSNISNGSSAFEDKIWSLFSNVQYSYDDRYLLEGTIRRDGSSRFGEENIYGVFPSGSVGWRISNENFMSDFDWLDELRLKASYGILGSQNNVSSVNQYDLYGGGFGDAYYPIGGGQSLTQGFRHTRIGNPRTSWERNRVTNIGLELGLIQKLDFSVEYYQKSIDGLLFPQPLPSTVGGATPPTVNIGDIRNRGVDITANYSGQLSDNLQLNVGSNITTYQNEVVDVPDPGYFNTGGHQQLGNTVRNEEGHPVSSFFGYDVIGLFQSEQDVESSPTQTDAAPGRFKFRDVNGDGQITADDRTFIGNPNPDFTYGINLGVNYRNFDVSTQLYGSQGADVVNTVRVYNDFLGVYPGAKSERLLDAWTPENTDTSIPKIEGSGSFSTTAAMSSYFVEDGSYLRVRSMMIGYSIPDDILEILGIRSLRIYTQATNLFTITDYTGLDPEVGGGSASFGIDYGTYPPSERSVTFGINLSF